MIPILAGFIATSIADKPGFAPGLVGGFIASGLPGVYNGTGYTGDLNVVGSGFLGAIVAGLLAGYVVKFLKEKISLPRSLESLKPIIILPVLGAAIVGLAMFFILNIPLGGINDGLTNWLKDIPDSQKVLLGLILGAMMAFDMGGPVNKVAYTFGTGLLASTAAHGNDFLPMAAVMAAGMTPPLGLWLATLIAPKKFTSEERDSGKSAFVLGISFITEGAIPFAAADPARVIPSIMVGSAVTGALSMLFSIELHAGHGGIWVLPMGVINKVGASNFGAVGLYALAIVVGTVVTALMVSALKKNVEA
jgi:PTS system fructose-specific IIC component